MFALGLLSWMYGRPTESTIAFLTKRFAKVPDIRDANITAFKAGWNFGETTEAFAVSYEIKPAPSRPGTYRNISGNLALAYGLVAAGVQSELPVFLGTYPITPASDILHELSKHKGFGITTFQAEDEIAGVGAAIGASFAGSLGVTSTSGPGVALKSEAIGLAVMTELPLLVINVQRGGPRPGCRPRPSRPTCSRPCSAATARPRPDRGRPVTGRLLRRRRRGRPDRDHLPHPVLLLSDGYLANGSEPWAIPDVDSSRSSTPPSPPQPNHISAKSPDGQPDEFWPYLRDEDTLARPWAIPGTAGPGAPHRWPGEGRRTRQHLLRPRQPRAHGPHPPGQDRPHRRLPPPLAGRRPLGCGEGLRPRLGLDLRARSAPPPPRAQGRVQRRPGPPAPPQPVPQRPRRDPRGATTRSSSPR